MEYAQIEHVTDLLAFAQIITGIKCECHHGDIDGGGIIKPGGSIFFIIDYHNNEQFYFNILLQFHQQQLYLKF